MDLGPCFNLQWLMFAETETLCGRLKMCFGCIHTQNDASMLRRQELEYTYPNKDYNSQQMSAILQINGVPYIYTEPPEIGDLGMGYDDHRRMSRDRGTRYSVDEFILQEGNPLSLLKACSVRVTKMKMDSTDDVMNARGPCSSISKDNGGLGQETDVQSSNSTCRRCTECRHLYRRHVVFTCCVGVVIVTLCCVIMAYTNHACGLTKDNLHNRLMNIEQKLHMLQRKNTIAKFSKLMTDKDTAFRNRRRLGEEIQNMQYERRPDSTGNILSTKASIVKRSAGCDKNRKRCQRKMKRLKKKINLMKAKSTGTSMGTSFMHFEAADNDDAPNGKFHKWKYADWSYGKEKLKKQFDLKTKTGDVVIDDSGIYMLYAQVTLMGEPDQGFSVAVHQNDGRTRILAKCMMDFAPYACNQKCNSSESGNPDPVARIPPKSHSCSSVGIFRLAGGDTVYLKHSKDTRVTANFQGNASFFGFVKLADE